MTLVHSKPVLLSGSVAHALTLSIAGSPPVEWLVVITNVLPLNKFIGYGVNSDTQGLPPVVYQLPPVLPVKTI